MLVTTAPRGSSTAKHLSCNASITRTEVPASHRKWPSQKGWNPADGRFPHFVKHAIFQGGLEINLKTNKHTLLTSYPLEN